MLEKKKSLSLLITLGMQALELHGGSMRSPKLLGYYKIQVGDCVVLGECCIICCGCRVT